MTRLTRRHLLMAAAGGATLPLAGALRPARAAESLRVAKVVPFAWTFTPLDIGIQEGIFA